MSTWHEAALFTVDNPGVSSAELASRARLQMIADGRGVGRRTRKKQGKCEQLIIDL